MATDNTFYADKIFISGIKPNGSFPLIEANSVCVDNNITKLLPNYLLPEATTADEGKLLGINSSGQWGLIMKIINLSRQDYNILIANDLIEENTMYNIIEE